MQLQQQSLSNAIGQVKARADIENKEKEKEENSGQSFLDKHRARLHSGEAHYAHDTARRVGLMRAKAFTDSIRVASHPQHEKKLQSFHTAFGSSFENVDNAYIKAACDEFNAPPPEELRENKAYEDRIEQQYRPQGAISLHDVAWFDVLKNDLADSRHERGYGSNKAFDNEVISAWKAKYYPNKS